MKLKSLALCLVISFTILGNISIHKVYADVDPSNSILVDIIPPNPKPYENVTINLNSYENNLDSVPINWSVKDKTLTSGVGVKSFSIKAPALGEETDVVVTISLSDGVVQKKIPIKPSTMILLWQANDSYVPPFYRGKALPTPDSEVKVVAMPEIKIGSTLMDPNNMTYYWKMNYTNNVDGSGYGKNFFLYISDYLEDSDNISVTASTIDQNSSSAASIDVTTQQQPKILFYKNDPKMGTLWQNALADSFKIQEKDVIEAIPYFISPKELQHPSLIWNWFINDDRVNVTGFRKNLMPLQVQANVHGTSKLRLNMENKDKIFQTAEKEITIEF